MAPRTVLNLLFAGAALAALVVLALRSEPDAGVRIEAGDPPPGVDELRVEVSGAVAQPGRVDAVPGDRVADAIARAGGATSEADTAPLNLSRRLHDLDRIVVPRLGERTALPDLNRATQADLEALPGLGTTYARAVIEARSAQPFSSTDDLVDRRILPARTYNQLHDLVTVR